MTKTIIKKAFTKSKTSYNKYAHMQKEIAQELYAKSKKYIKPNDIILEIGSGSGFLTKHIKNNLITIDIVKNHNNTIVADMDHLPLKRKFDIVISSMALHWSENIVKVFKNVKTIIKKNGLLICAMPIQPSQHTLQKALSKTFQHPAYFNFPSIQNILQTIKQLNGEITSLDIKKKTFSFPSFKKICRYFTKTGTHRYSEEQIILTKNSSKQLKKELGKRPSIEYTICFLTIKF
ncbi:methyltransferase domain-containing protein [Candidatus Margulisiibacteriota bacterium]